MKTKVSTEQALRNAAASVKMEGFVLSDSLMKLCKDAMEGKISYEEYLSIVKKQAGVSV